MESKSEKWQLKRIGTMSFISDECDNIKKSDKSLFANIIRNIFLEVIADFKELEQTIENMKAIAGEKIESVGSITSVDYPSDNTTEIIIEKEDYYGSITNITKTKCCGIAPITKENFCPNCGRKIIR